MGIFKYFNTWLECGYFILYRHDRGFWNIPKWHFARCYNEVTEQIYAEYKGWAFVTELEG